MNIEEKRRYDRRYYHTKRKAILAARTAERASHRVTNEDAYWPCPEYRPMLAEYKANVGDKECNPVIAALRERMQEHKRNCPICSEILNFVNPDRRRPVVTI